jgi:hypothetical protein
MAESLPDVADRDHFLESLLLDDWVALYVVVIKAESLSVSELPPQMTLTLNEAGLYKICSNIVDRMSERMFGPEATGSRAIFDNYKFNILAHLETAAVQAIMPSISEVPSPIFDGVATDD